MIPALLIKKIVPKILEIVLKQFKGIEKIDKLVKYMENENETDKQVKLHDAALKGLTSEIDELKSELEKWKKNA